MGRNTLKWDTFPLKTNPFDMKVFLVYDVLVWFLGVVDVEEEAVHDLGHECKLNDGIFIS